MKDDIFEYVLLESNKIKNDKFVLFIDKIQKNKYNNYNLFLKKCNYVKNSFSKELEKDTDSFVNKMMPHMKNISNSLTMSKGNYDGLSRSSITNNEKNFGLSDEPNNANNGLDKGIKLLDETIYNKQSINTSSLQEQLNNSENDSDASLNNEYTPDEVCGSFKSCAYNSIFIPLNSIGYVLFHIFFLACINSRTNNKLSLIS